MGLKYSDFHVETVVLHLGVYTELPRLASGIAEMSVAAKFQFPTLLVRGDAAQQFADLVAGQQRPIQHAHFAMQAHPRRLVWLQQQLLGTLLNREEEQIF